MRALGDTRTPSVSTTSPSTFTQPLVIQRSASRREHRPSSPMSLERRGCSGFFGDVGGRVMQKNPGRTGVAVGAADVNYRAAISYRGQCQSFQIARGRTCLKIRVAVGG